jgi:hypothetical protein
MDPERENYREPGSVPLWERPAVRRRAWAGGIAGFLIGAAVLAVVAFGGKMRSTSATSWSVERAMNLADGCRRYRLVYPEKGYPASLADLAQPIPGGGPLVDVDDLTDGFGHPFRYALVPNAAGELEPHIWAERTYDGKTTLHGAKLAADGTIVPFGVPAD